MRAEEGRQNEFLQRRLDARRQRRKAMQDELAEVEKKIRENEQVKAEEQDKVLVEIQEQTEKEMEDLKKEEEEGLQQIEE